MSVSSNCASSPEAVSIGTLTDMPERKRGTAAGAQVAHHARVVAVETSATMIQPLRDLHRWQGFAEVFGCGFLHCFPSEAVIHRRGG